LPLRQGSIIIFISIPLLVDFPDAVMKFNLGHSFHDENTYTFEEVDPNPLLLLIHHCRSPFPQTFCRPLPKIPAIAWLACALDPKKMLMDGQMA